MRVVIDLQGAQCGSRHRGIGRYTLSLALAMVRNGGEHEFLLVLNGLFPDTIETIRSAFDGLLPQESILVWNAAGPVHGFDTGNNWRRRAAELIRETFLASLQPDIVHVTSMMEGFGDDAVHSLNSRNTKIPTAVTFYDVIPLIQSEIYLKPNPHLEALYTEKLEHIKRADLLLAISESSRLEAMQYLDIPAASAVNIGAAADDYFQPKIISQASESRLREQFGLGSHFLMYSGATDERKNHLRLIKAYAILPADIRNQYRLAIVGGLPADHLEKFQSFVKLCELKSGEVIFTGRVTDDELVGLYNICDLFIFPSWHEGFGLPALEAMACGAPVIGSNTTSVPEVLGLEEALFDPFDERAISKKILDVLRDEEFRQRLIRHSQLQAKKFNWNKSAQLAIKAFEQLHSKSNREGRLAYCGQTSEHAITRLVREISSLKGAPSDEQIWATTAQALAQNHPAYRERHLLVDISELVQRDARTGIQRVVRSVLTELSTRPPAGYQVRLVYASHGRRGYRGLTGDLDSALRGEITTNIEDEALDVKPGDVFLGLDLHHIVLEQREFYQNLRNIGVKLYFVVYDLAPVLHRELFPAEIPNLHSKWLSCLANADGLVCISRAVADEMIDWLNVFGPKVLRPLKVGWFHLGADLENSAPSMGLPHNIELILKTLNSRPTFLMVGTVEPRKGQLQILQAFEKLWTEGSNINLVIVGKQGWNVALLAEMINTHTEFNKRLFWLKAISDEYLEKIYAAVTCLISASKAEGFGLPLIEAARRALPLLIRDLPVFREVAGDHAYYFSGYTPDDAAAAVCSWLALDESNQTPQSKTMPRLTWHESTRDLLKVILQNTWYTEWLADDVSRFWGSDSRLGTEVGARFGRKILTTGKLGYLLFGPFIPLAAGNYGITIHGLLVAGDARGAHIDIAYDQARSTVKNIELKMSDSDGLLASVQFILEKPCEDLELRVWVSEKSVLEVTLLQITPLLTELNSIDQTSVQISEKNKIKQDVADISDNYSGGLTGETRA